ncbi:MAG: hypothetical protein KKB50_05685 [Planctomycetes bacterium]|nr:hypothetical protein [Planctomycetota bacterium]
MARLAIGFGMLALFTLWTTEEVAAQDKKPAQPQAAKQDKSESKAEADGDATGTVDLVCPVTGKPVSQRFYVYLEGRRVLFATSEAIAEYRKNPEKYLEGVQAQLAQRKLLRVQVKCPVTGKPINPRSFADMARRRVYFGVDHAKMEWIKWSAEQQREALKDCYSYQTLCPIDQRQISPKVYCEYNKGCTAYFCCKECQEKFEKEPQKYIKQIEEQIKANKAEWEKRRQSKPRQPAKAEAEGEDEGKVEDEDE